MAEIKCSLKLDELHSEIQDGIWDYSMLGKPNYVEGMSEKLLVVPDEVNKWGVTSKKLFSLWKVVVSSESQCHMEELNILIETLCKSCILVVQTSAEEDLVTSALFFLSVLATPLSRISVESCTEHLVPSWDILNSSLDAVIICINRIPEILMGWDTTRFIDEKQSILLNLVDRLNRSKGIFTTNTVYKVLKPIDTLAKSSAISFEVKVHFLGHISQKISAIGKELLFISEETRAMLSGDQFLLSMFLRLLKDVNATDQIPLHAALGCCRISYNFLTSCGYNIRALEEATEGLSAIPSNTLKYAMWIGAAAAFFHNVREKSAGDFSPRERSLFLFHRHFIVDFPFTYQILPKEITQKMEMLYDLLFSDHLRKKNLRNPYQWLFMGKVELPDDNCSYPKCALLNAIAVPSIWDLKKAPVSAENNNGRTVEIINLDEDEDTVRSEGGCNEPSTSGCNRMRTSFDGDEEDDGKDCEDEEESEQDETDDDSDELESESLPALPAFGNDESEASIIANNLEGISKDFSEIDTMNSVLRPPVLQLNSPILPLAEGITCPILSPHRPQIETFQNTETGECLAEENEPSSHSFSSDSESFSGSINGSPFEGFEDLTSTNHTFNTGQWNTPEISASPVGEPKSKRRRENLSIDMNFTPPKDTKRSPIKRHPFRPGEAFVKMDRLSATELDGLTNVGNSKIKGTVRSIRCSSPVDTGINTFEVSDCSVPRTYEQCNVQRTERKTARICSTTTSRKKYLLEKSTEIVPEQNTWNPGSSLPSVAKMPSIPEAVEATSTEVEEDMPLLKWAAIQSRRKSKSFPIKISHKPSCTPLELRKRKKYANVRFSKMATSLRFFKEESPRLSVRSGKEKLEKVPT